MPLSRLINYIDWKPFFEVWQLRGKYPNRAYPKIFDDETVGSQAKKVFEEAQAMLGRIVKENLLKAKVQQSLHMFHSPSHVMLQGIIGIFPANAVHDDIELYADDTRISSVGKYVFPLAESILCDGFMMR